MTKAVFWKIRDMSKPELIRAITRIANKKGKSIRTSNGIIYPGGTKDYRYVTFWNYTERLIGKKEYPPEDYMKLNDLRKYTLEEIYAELLGYETTNARGEPYFYGSYTWQELGHKL